jgi:hypothetical protein
VYAEGRGALVESAPQQRFTTLLVVWCPCIRGASPVVVQKCDQLQLDVSLVGFCLAANISLRVERPSVRVDSAPT